MLLLSKLFKLRPIYFLYNLL